MKFSIIIPVYNVAPYLRACLNSLRCQKMNSETADSWTWEAICVDDGSSDGSGKILDEYARCDDRFRVIHQPNAGVAAARNVALEVVTGEWIAFLDADDVWNPHALGRLASMIEQAPQADVVAFNWFYFDAEEDPAWPQSSKENNFALIDSRERLSAKKACSSFVGKIYRRDLVGGVRFKPYCVGEDLLFLLEVMLKSSCVAEIDDVLYGYRQRPGSAINSKMSLDKLRDELNYNLDELKLIRQASKIVSAQVVRLAVNRIFERACYFVTCLPHQDRTQGRLLWHRALKATKDLGLLTFSQRLRVLVYNLFPFGISAAILFVLPFWLKKNGFHRG